MVPFKCIVSNYHVVYSSGFTSLYIKFKCSGKNNYKYIETPNLKFHVIICFRIRGKMSGSRGYAIHDILVVLYYFLSHFVNPFN